MTVVAVERKVVPVAAFDDRLFRGLKPETEDRGTKTATVKENETMKLLMQAWKEYCKTDEQKRFDRYIGATRLLNGIKFSSEDVSRFCLSFSDECDRRKMSMFINALIEKCTDDTVTIYVSHIGELNDIGYYTTKNIIIYGNVGSKLGRHKNAGYIVLYGNATLGVLEDTGGEITVTINGDVKLAAGKDMGSKCKLIINGNAGHGLGVYANGGEIYITGKIASLGHNIGKETKIYQNGKLIFADGNLVGVLNE